MQIEKNIPLAPLTTLQIGGKAKYFVQIETPTQLQEALNFAHQNNIQWLIIGGGSNLLISDQGYDGLIIKMINDKITFDQGVINVQAGTKLQDLVDFTVQNGLDGLSTMTGIPGTVGGAIYGSAGAYGDNIRDYLTEVTYLDTKNNQINKITKDQFSSGYRDSIFKKHKNYIILEAKFAGFTSSSKTEIEKECAEILTKRQVKYPPGIKCPGSFFKNIIASDLNDKQLQTIPPDKILFGKIPAGYLLETVGAKGTKKGNIMVAENHGNTFINLGNGTAQDFYDLAQELATKVYQKYGIVLEPEVQFINLPPFKLTAIE